MPDSRARKTRRLARTRRWQRIQRKPQVRLGLAALLGVLALLVQPPLPALGVWLAAIAMLIVAVLLESPKGW
jgi:hypothetical protein